MPRSSKRQSRLAFTPLPSSSPAAKEYHKQIQDRAAAVSIEDSPSSTRHKKKRRTNGVSKTIPTPSVSVERADSDSEDDDAILVAARPEKLSISSNSSRKIRKYGKKQGRLDFTRSRDATSFDSAVTLPSSSQAPSSSGVFKSKRRKTKDEQDESSDDDGAEELRSSPRITRSTQKAAITVDSDSEESPAPRQQNPIEEESEDEDEEDAMPTTLGTQRSRQKRKRAPSLDSFISSPPAAAESEDNESEESEGVVPTTTPRRRLKRRRQVTQQEEEDLAEDLDFLNPDSDAENSARKPRSSQSAKKTAQQKALERLKSKRSGRPMAVEESEDEAADDVDGYLDGEEQDGLEADSDEDVQILSQAPMSSRQMFNANEDDEDFIEEEDEDNILGVPDGVPLEFTRYASMKGKELFKFAVEWMVQKKINPAFRMEDEIYDLTFRKLNDEITGLAGSKFTSSAWTPQFTLALRSRPEISYSPIDRTQPEHFMNDHCDACNRTGHPATFEVQFQGTPYHPTTLDEVGGEDEDEDEDDEESADSNAAADNKPTYNHEGREVPRADLTFYLGKFCMANAETAHSLHHWKLHLFQIVEAYLISRGYNTSDKIVQRDGWSTRKRRKYANKVVDRMEKDGEVKDLWGKFKENIDHARNAKLAGRFGAR